MAQGRGEGRFPHSPRPLGPCAGSMLKKQPRFSRITLLDEPLSISDPLLPVRPGVRDHWPLKEPRIQSFLCFSFSKNESLSKRPSSDGMSTRSLWEAPRLAALRQWCQSPSRASFPEPHAYSMVPATFLSPGPPERRGRLPRPCSSLWVFGTAAGRGRWTAIGEPSPQHCQGHTHSPSAAVTV